MNPYFTNTWELRKKALFALGTAFAVIIILFFVQPAGLIKIVWLKKMIWLVISLGVNYGVFYFIQLLVFSHIFKEETNKTKQILVLNIAFITIISLVSIAIISPFFPNVEIFKKANLYLSSFTLISLFHLVFYFLSKQFSKKMVIINEHKNGNEVLNINDKSTTISIPVKNIFYINSSGNYIEIIEKNNLKGHLLRYSLKDLDGQFKELYRCHKSFIVNVGHIAKITGNSKGYKIILDELPELTIPVSRTKGEELSNLISA